MNHPSRNKRAAARGGPHPTGAELAQMREEIGETQSEFAERIRVRLKTYQDYEYERRKMAPGLYEYLCLQLAFPQEMGRLLRRWRSGNPLAT